MQYFFFPITREEAEKPNSCGYGFIQLHPERLIETNDLIEINTYDKGTSMVVHDGVVYNVHKDYVDLTNHRRIYLCIEKKYGNEV